jgi:large subunit ribosomal protein L19
MDRISNWTQDDLRKDIPTFGSGDTVNVWVRVIEGDKERLQAFQGIVLGRSGSGLDEMFTVRKISMGVGVERIFPLHSPTVARIEVLRKGRVRRAKLNYLKSRKGKSARIQEKERAKVLTTGVAVSVEGEAVGVATQ